VHERKTVDDTDAIFAACTRFLTHHYPRSPRQTLLDLAAFASPEATPDRYGQGELIASFEQQIAELLGKPAAVFMPSGTMCQQIALRIWSERRGSRSIAFHPTCHLELHEDKGYQLLHGLHGRLVGHASRLIGLDDLRAIREPLGALLLELPQREIGGQLPSWEELVGQIDWARQRGIPTHLDGARLWECKPFYGRAYAEIAALFDTIYVSFYKTLGGIAGAVLAGPTDVIGEARVWQHRHGGTVIHLFPYVLAAQQGLTDRLGRIEAYCQKAVEVAEALRALPQIAIVPDPPVTNMMHLYIRGEAARLEAAALDVARETRIRLVRSFAPTELPGYQRAEFVAGDATLDLTNGEIVALFQSLLRRAEA
jgi:threonine aldolase